jgi:hypothetical protein
MVDSKCTTPALICEYCADGNNNEKIETTFYYCVEHRGSHMQTQHSG